MHRPAILFLMTLIFGLSLLLHRSQQVAEAASNTLTVCQSGCNHTTIQAAVNAATSGTTIKLTDAIHIEAGINIGKNVTLSGVSSTATKLHGAASAAAATNRVINVQNGSTVIIRDLTISFGQAPHGTLASPHGADGGAIFNDGELTLYSVQLSKNRAGDGFDCDATTCNVGGEMPDSRGGNGGAIFSTSSSKLTIIDSSMTDNTSGRGGDCDASGCVANYHGGSGAALYALGESTISGSSIEANQLGGGGLCSTGLCPDHGDGFGAVAAGDAAYLHMRNSTVAFNFSSQTAAALWSDAQATVVLNNVTVAQNGAVGRGVGSAPAIVLNGAGSIANSIVADNFTGDCILSLSIAALGGNLDSDGSCDGFSIHLGNAHFSGLATAGGPTRVYQIDWDSEAIDAGVNCEVVDQRGFLRSLDSTGCDLGAYEKIVASNCAAPNLAIPDGVQPGAQSSLGFVPFGTVLDLKLRLNATHSYVGDMQAVLRTGGGLQATVFDRPGHPAVPAGCMHDNIDAAFFDGGDSSAENTCNITPPALSGSLTPDAPFSLFAGQSLSGAWTLELSDHNVGNTGQFDLWCLDADYIPISAANVPPKMRLSASQTSVGPGDTFYYRLDFTTNTNGWTQFETFTMLLAHPSSVAMTFGTPIVPDGTGFSCQLTPPTSPITCSGGTLAPNQSYTFWFPVTNPAANGCTTGNVTATVGDNQSSPLLDRISLPNCTATSVGSTHPQPPASVVTAVGLLTNDRQALPPTTVAIAAVFVLLFGMTAWSKRS